MKIKDAIIESAISRFRPIVLTTITTVFGLAPLLLSNSVSAQFIKPTAIAIAYGLIFGLVLSLTFLPSILLLINQLKVKFYRIRHRNSDKEPEELDVVLKEIKNELA
jgi:multidrug efflux pump subunit AcrB